MNYISDKEFALLKRTGVSMDDPNLGNTMRVLGDSFGTNSDDGLTITSCLLYAGPRAKHFPDLT